MGAARHQAESGCTTKPMWLLRNVRRVLGCRCWTRAHASLDNVMFVSVTVASGLGTCNVLNSAQTKETLQDSHHSRARLVDQSH